MKIKNLIYTLSSVVLAVFCATSCNEDSTIGSSLSRGEVTIEVDSIFSVTGKSSLSPELDSKTITQLIGRLSVPEYGDLHCTFVSQLMPAAAMDIPDSITSEMVDSIRLRFRLSNGAFTGDSLAPQKLQVFRLNKQLPSDITNSFDPAGYYDATSILGEKSYTASALGMLDTVYKTQSRSIWVNMPKKFALDVFDAYRNNPDIFSWPDKFIEYFPGLYVEQSFGRGLVVNITNTEMITYYHHRGKTTVVEDGVAVSKDTTIVDSATLFSVSPEIISSNNIRMRIADSLKQRIDNSEPILISPCGYNVEINFPAQEILNRYWSSGFNLAVINNLTLSIPVDEIKNDYGITPPPYLLLVKTKDLENFFANNEIPDDKESFWATYDSTTRRYTFTSMRDYIVELMRNGSEVAPEDTQFTIVPVSISTETTTSQSAVVSDCSPYIAHPAMCKLKLDEAKVKFTFSKQVIN